MRSHLLRVPVVPVLVITDLEAVAPLVRALALGGLDVVEITLRTPRALDAIRRIAAEVPEVIVGAGTVTTPDQIAAAAKAGAEFLVSPGSTPDLVTAAKDADIPFLPGASSVSEMMVLRDQGFGILKFFPAEASGGVAALQAIAGPLSEIEFVPTGGVNENNASEYLGLPNVLCVGGSWVAPAAAIKTGDWSRITELACAASSLRLAD